MKVDNLIKPDDILDVDKLLKDGDFAMLQRVLVHFKADYEIMLKIKGGIFNIEAFARDIKRIEEEVEKRENNRYIFTIDKEIKFTGAGLCGCEDCKKNKVNIEGED